MQGGRPNPHGPCLSVNLPLVWIAQGLFASERLLAPQTLAAPSHIANGDELDFKLKAKGKGK